MQRFNRSSILSQWRLVWVSLDTNFKCFETQAKTGHCTMFMSRVLRHTYTHIATNQVCAETRDVLYNLQSGQKQMNIQVLLDINLSHNIEWTPSFKALNYLYKIAFLLTHYALSKDPSLMYLRTICFNTTHTAFLTSTACAGEVWRWVYLNYYSQHLTLTGKAAFDRPQILHTLAHILQAIKVAEQRGTFAAFLLLDVGI